MEMPDEQEMSAPAAAKALNISRQRIYQLIGFGMVPYRKVGRNYLIPVKAIEDRIAGDKRLNSNQCVTAQEVADFFGTNVRTVRDWHTSGELRAMKINNLLCFAPADVAAFIPRTYSSSGRYPARTPTRTLRGRHYPEPPGQQQPPERNRK